RLAADQRWGDFWSVSGSWRIINEQFMQGIPWLNDLRIRASHGISGTLPSSYYYHKSFYSSGSLERYGDDGGYRITSAFNPNLTWEKNESSNLAVETMVFNKIKLSVDFYNKLTTDLLMNASTASISGLTSYLRNIGNMRNRGVEIDVNVDIIKKQDVSWSVGVNWTGNKNEIVKMSFDGEKIQSTPWRREVGYSFYQYFTREYLGVEPATGRPMFARNTILPDGTLDKSVVYDARDASNVRIDGKTGDPDGYGGITTTFRYKGLSVNMMFGYAYGHFVFDQTQDTNQTDGGTLFFRSIHSEQLRRWQQPGDITDVPRRIPYTYAGYYNSTRMILPGDYLRLKNMTIAYSLPQNWVRRVSLDGVRVYASGTNLFTFTGLYFDPETPRIGGFANYNTPPVRTISFGLEINL
ncbi:MAG: TonB-dependent receptor, partial [Bacteroidales bacterium]|nr:TonB-dependent receptor [Bacteroidales bacterium]